MDSMARTRLDSECPTLQDESRQRVLGYSLSWLWVWALREFWVLTELALSLCTQGVLGVP